MNRRLVTRGTLLLILALLAATVLGLTGCKNQNEGPEAPLELTVFCAISMDRPVNEIAERIADRLSYATGRETRLTLNTGGTQTLAQQALAGARCDIFISANRYWLDRLEAAGLTVPGTRMTIASNALIVIAAKDTLQPMATPCELIGKRIIMGDSASVPVGMYAKAWLQTVSCDGRPLLETQEGLGIRPVYTTNAKRVVDTAAATVGTVGITYATELPHSPGVEAVYRIPRDQQPEIAYEAVLLDQARSSFASAMLEGLRSAKGAETFQDYGFLRPRPTVESNGK